MTVRHAIKGFETHMHDSAAEARRCTELGGPDRYHWEIGAQADADAEFAAEAAVERYFEERGYWAAREQEEHEARMGALSFEQAWHLQSPQTCPCPDHDDH